AQNGAPAPAADFAADAAPPPDPYWSAQIPSGVLDGANNQPLAIPAFMAGNVTAERGEVAGLPYVQVAVATTTTPEVHDGSLTYHPNMRAVLWAPSEPIDTGTGTVSFDVMVTFENERMAADWGTNVFSQALTGGFQWQVGAATDPLTAPTL